MDKFEKFVQSVDYMIQLTEEHALSWEDKQDYFSRPMWLRNFATVHLTLPRAVGKTSYINKRARCADAVIVHNQEMKSQYKNSCARIFIPHELNQLGRGCGRVGFNRVYVDEPRLVFNQWFSKDDLMAVFGGVSNPSVCANMIIMLGT